MQDSSSPEFQQPVSESLSLPAENSARYQDKSIPASPATVNSQPEIPELDVWRVSPDPLISVKNVKKVFPMEDLRGYAPLEETADGPFEMADLRGNGPLEETVDGPFEMTAFNWKGKEAERPRHWTSFGKSTRHGLISPSRTPPPVPDKIPLSPPWIRQRPAPKKGFTSLW